MHEMCSFMLLDKRGYSGMCVCGGGGDDDDARERGIKNGAGGGNFGGRKVNAQSN